MMGSWEQLPGLPGSACGRGVLQAHALARTGRRGEALDRREVAAGAHAAASLRGAHSRRKRGWRGQGRRTSSGVKGSFFSVGSSWLNQRSRQLLPLRPLPRLCTAEGVPTHGPFAQGWGRAEHGPGRMVVGRHGASKQTQAARRQAAPLQSGSSSEAHMSAYGREGGRQGGGGHGLPAGRQKMASRFDPAARLKQTLSSRADAQRTCTSCTNLTSSCEWPKNRKFGAFRCPQAQGCSSSGWANRQGGCQPPTNPWPRQGLAVLNSCGWCERKRAEAGRDLVR